MSRGFFEIGIYQGKTSTNIGTLWRSAYQLGANGIFTIGQRFQRERSDTVRAFKHIPKREYTTFEEFLVSVPYSTPIVAIEFGGKPLHEYKHPTRCIYLLGAEDKGIPDAILNRCHECISVPSIRTLSYNVAVAGSIVMYDRVFNGKERLI